MLISGPERDVCLAILRDMVHSADEAAYSRNMEHLEGVGCSHVLEYVRSSWHDVRSQWVEGLKEQYLTLGETTTQRLDNVSVEMKNLCSEMASLQQFFVEFRSFLVTMRAERTHHVMMMLTRKPTTALPEDLLPYRDSLTPYAFHMVHQQYTESLRLGPCSEVDEDVDTFIFASSTGTDTTRLGCCSCCVYTSRRLPCKHLLYVRRLRGAEFDESVFDSRWKRADYISHCQLNLTNGGSIDLELLDMKNGEEDLPSTDGKHKAEQRSVEQAEKYRKARHMTDQLASLCSRPGTTVFLSRLKLLQKLYDCWSKGFDASIVKSESADSTPSSVRKRGRPPKAHGKTSTNQKRCKTVGRPKNSIKVKPQKPKRKYHRFSAPSDDDNMSHTDGDVDGGDEDGKQQTAVSDNEAAVLLAMVADTGMCLSENDDNDAETEDAATRQSAYAEAGGSNELDNIPGEDNVADIGDCLPADDDASYVILPENSGLLTGIGHSSESGSRLELRPLDAMNDIHMPLQPKRKRGRPRNCEKTAAVRNSGLVLLS